MNKVVGYQKGVNLGGWLSQGSLKLSHLDSFIKEEDIKRIKEEQKINLEKNNEKVKALNNVSYQV